MARNEASCSIGWCVGPSSPEADRIVGEDIDGRNLHQGGQPDRGAHVVAEIEEGAAESPDLRNRHAIQGGAHTMFAHAEMQVASAVAARLEISGAIKLKPRPVGARQVGRAADQPGDILWRPRSKLSRNSHAWPCLSRRRETWADSCPSRRAVRAVCMRLIWSARSGYFFPYSANSVSHFWRSSPPRLPIPFLKFSSTPSGTRNFASSGQP